MIMICKTTLRDELLASRADYPGDNDPSGIADYCRDLIDPDGAETLVTPSTTGPWYVVRTAFHGGGLVSRHHTVRRALLAAQRKAAGDCTCGCVGVVHHTAYDKLPGPQETSANGYVLAASCDLVC